MTKQQQFEGITEGLSVRDRAVLAARYGVYGDRKSCEEIGRSGIFKQPVTRQWVSQIQDDAEKELGEEAAKVLAGLFPRPPSRETIRRTEAAARRAILSYLEGLNGKPVRYADALRAAGMEVIDPALEAASEEESCGRLFEVFRVRDFGRYRMCSYGGSFHLAKDSDFYRDKKGRRTSFCKAHNVERCREFQRAKRAKTKSAMYQRPSE